MRRPYKGTVALQSLERIDQARELLHQDCQEHARRLGLSDEEMAEVLDDLVEWYGGRPGQPRYLLRRRARR